jgi:predicted RNA-binding protein with PUA-like domain
MNYWLLKSEPSVFGIDDLQAMPDATEHWDGVRNYQARNFIRDGMKQGDLAFFYHSNCKEPGIVGIVEIVREAYPDFTASDPESQYYDPRSSAEDPRWYMVDVRFVRKFERTIPLTVLKSSPELQDMPLVRRGNRLSVMPVSEPHWRFIMHLSEQS